VTRWGWVRHGPTHAKGMVGWTDLPADLSDSGTIERLIAALPEQALVISSDLIRAVATADLLPGTRLPHEAGLREIGFGDWEQLTADEVSARHGALARRYWEQPGDIAPPGGESWNTLCQRVAETVDRLTLLHPGRDIVCVAHFGVILSELQRANGQTAVEAFSQPIAPLSLSRVDIRAGQRQCLFANRRFHHDP